MISIPCRFLFSDLSDEAIGLISYIFMSTRQTTQAENDVPAYIGTDTAEFILYGNRIRTKDHQKTAVGVLRELCAHNYLQEVPNFSSIYMVNKDAIRLDVGEETYVRIDAAEFYVFVNSGERSRWGLYHLFCLYLSFVSKEYKYLAGNRPINYYAKIMQVTPRTITRYTEVLEKMEMIYVQRFKFKLKEGERLCNITGRFCDKDIITNFIPDQEYNVAAANWRRGVSIKYNKYKENPDSFDDKELQDLMDAVEQYNRMQDAYHNPDGRKDTSVFNLTK